jgi:hypothetical protein
LIKPKCYSRPATGAESYFVGIMLLKAGTCGRSNVNRVTKKTWVDATSDCEFQGHFEGHKGQKVEQIDFSRN